VNASSGFTSEVRVYFDSKGTRIWEVLREGNANFGDPPEFTKVSTKDAFKVEVTDPLKSFTSAQTCD